MAQRVWLKFTLGITTLLSLAIGLGTLSCQAPSTTQQEKDLRKELEELRKEIKDIKEKTPQPSPAQKQPIYIPPYTPPPLDFSSDEQRQRQQQIDELRRRQEEETRRQYLAQAEMYEKMAATAVAQAEALEADRAKMYRKPSDALADLLSDEVGTSQVAILRKQAAEYRKLALEYRLKAGVIRYP